MSGGKLESNEGHRIILSGVGFLGFLLFLVLGNSMVLI